MTAWSLQPDWRRLFPAEGYRFQMGLRVASARDFFAPSADADRLLRERRRWLAEEPHRHVVLAPDGIPLLDEFAAWLQGAGGGDQAPDPGPATTGVRVWDAGWARLITVASEWEPDFVLLAPANGPSPKVVAGAVCFPSSWALEEKLGQTLTGVHAPVPGLNTALGERIDAALARLPAGVGWVRQNWGLATDAELNRHPARGLVPLGPGARLDTTWLRLEHQVLFRLPRSGGIAFGIRVTVHPLCEVVRDPPVGNGIVRALLSMTPEVAAYKGLAEARAGLVSQLETRSLA